ncbi:MAG TPA: XrtA system polysaccharide deacetylase [Rhizomicrobium sp.]|nr:XrtA system polysaccharide deacetylase [Rhizomicrobium sp.]
MIINPLDNDPIVGWRRRPVQNLTGSPLNAMTVDVEDYFQVEAFFPHIARQEWDRRECRVERNVERILQLFADTDTKATFFTLGWIAERYPQLVRRIVENGHELASHGLAHYRADHQSRQQFLADVTRAKTLLENIGGVAVNGYRATSFSISRRNLWALNALDEAGYKYSSSTFPIQHDLYGIPEQPRFAFYPFSDSQFVEIPITTLRRFGRNWPSGGGGYFRLFPYGLFKRSLKAIRAEDRQPCTFYFHPWEIDADQPRIPGTSLKTRVRHYLNLNRTFDRLRMLLNDFRWSSVDQVFFAQSASRQ